MTIDIHVQVTTDGTRDDAIKDLRDMLDLDGMEDEEHGLTTIDDITIEGEK